MSFLTLALSQRDGRDLYRADFPQRATVALIRAKRVLRAR